MGFIKKSVWLNIFCLMGAKIRCPWKVADKDAPEGYFTQLMSGIM